MPPNQATDPPDAAREQLAALGLDNFETAAAVAQRQQAMVRALARTNAPRGLIRELGRCNPDTCGPRRCRDGCHEAQARLRAALIPQADLLVRAQPGPLRAVTLVHPLWEVADAAGPGAISISAVKQHVSIFIAGRGQSKGLTACRSWFRRNAPRLRFWSSALPQPGS
ncbi:hypothetical protein [Methylobacterium sp. SyP6R]|uniref:hypothetical protein n=1 Tax=Methylobacterium sp. SyP6R TaxID=2718876 RepID=UPI001F23CA5E|nr:hypothetical protein [Methylobacterium sp. SyP6R]MCF4124970.1 hypothetical protein [Methylobacterium sp. SyP6R]